MADDPAASGVKDEPSAVNNSEVLPEANAQQQEKSVTGSRPQVPRDNLITTAVHFLQNPRVQKSPLSQKRAFLLKKGLTQSEVDLALDRLGLAGPVAMATTNAPPVPPTPGHSNSNALSPWHPGFPVLESSPSLWQRWRDMCTSAMVIGATCYGVYYLYKEYLEPALIGQKRVEEDRLDRVERHLLELNKSLSQLRNTLSTMETSLAKQTSSRHLEFESESKAKDYISLTEIRAEMASIKALLLSRKQFPATPASSANIPAWQLEEQEKNNNQQQETIPKQIEQDHEETTQPILNGVAVNGDASGDD